MRFEETHVSVSPDDTLEVVCAMAREFPDEKVGYLVMANDVNAGGGYLRGTNGQEESVCRRTNIAALFGSMVYPIPEYGSFYVHDSLILRDSERNSYAMLAAAVRADCVLAAAYHDPPSDAKDRLCDGYRERTRRKINAILNAFLANDCHNVVLGAFGCGAFGNPVGDIAALFREALADEPYAHAFRRIVFAVLKEAGGANYRAFTQAFAY